MAIDLTQFIEGDDILVTYRATVYGNAGEHLSASIIAREGGIAIGRGLPLEAAVSAEHITPEIKPDQWYMAGQQLYVGGTGGWLYGPLGGQRPPDRHGPAQVALIRGLRPAKVQPA